MNLSEKPLIYLFNTPQSTQDILIAKNFNAHAKRMNGYKKYNFAYDSHIQIPYQNEIPTDVHEAEIVVIDTESRNYFIANENTNAMVSVYFKDTPSILCLTPLDISLIIRQIIFTNKKQLILFFASDYFESSYSLLSNGNISQPTPANSLSFPPSAFNVIQRAGRRIKIHQNKEEKEIKGCLEKYLDDATYKIVIRAYASDTILAVNDGNEPISIMRQTKDKTVIILPNLQNKEGFLAELFEKILPEHPDFSILFPSNNNFIWTKDFSYLSIEERNKITEINDELATHAIRLESLREEYDVIHNKYENVKLRNMLKETGDDLVSSVKWFLEYIGFINITDPDKDVDVNAGEVFEEDLNFEHNGIHFLLEVKGIGGTSTDAQCAQISKIALRRKRAFPENIYKAIYIVNHQRYQAPKERVLVPFNQNQIDDAEMAQRGMTFTYELFNIYHMIEASIISKEAAREAFCQEGLIDFRHSLHKLEFNHCYDRAVVYSLIIPEDSTFTVSKDDYIAVQDDENHWYRLSIESIEIDGKAYEEVSNGKVGIKVDSLVPRAKYFYVLKTS